MAARYPMPSVLSPVIDVKTGKLTTPWVNYLKGLEEVAARVAEPVEDLGGAAGIALVRAKVNELLAALRASSQQEPS